MVFHFYGVTGGRDYCYLCAKYSKRGHCPNNVTSPTGNSKEHGPGKAEESNTRFYRMGQNG